MTYGEEKNQSVEINTGMTQMIKLIDKYIKTSIINVSYIFKQLEEHITCQVETWKMEKNPNRYSRDESYNL